MVRAFKALLATLALGVTLVLVPSAASAQTSDIPEGSQVGSRSVFRGSVSYTDSSGTHGVVFPGSSNFNVVGSNYGNRSTGCFGDWNINDVFTVGWIYPVPASVVGSSDCTMYAAALEVRVGGAVAATFEPVACANLHAGSITCYSKSDAGAWNLSSRLLWSYVLAQDARPVSPFEPTQAQLASRMHTWTADVYDGDIIDCRYVAELTVSPRAGGNNYVDIDTFGLRYSPGDGAPATSDCGILFATVDSVASGGTLTRAATMLANVSGLSECSVSVSGGFRDFPMVSVGPDGRYISQPSSGYAEGDYVVAFYHLSAAELTALSYTDCSQAVSLPLNSRQYVMRSSFSYHSSVPEIVLTDSRRAQFRVGSTADPGAIGRVDIQTIPRPQSGSRIQNPLGEGAFDLILGDIAGSFFSNWADRFLTCLTAVASWRDAVPEAPTVTGNDPNGFFQSIADFGLRAGGWILSLGRTAVAGITTAIAYSVATPICTAYTAVVPDGALMGSYVTQILSFACTEADVGFDSRELGTTDPTTIGYDLSETVSCGEWSWMWWFTFDFALIVSRGYDWPGTGETGAVAGALPCRGPLFPFSDVMRRVAEVTPHFGGGDTGLAEVDPLDIVPDEGQFDGYYMSACEGTVIRKGMDAMRTYASLVTILMCFVASWFLTRKLVSIFNVNAPEGTFDEQKWGTHPDNKQPSGIKSYKRKRTWNSQKVGTLRRYHRPKGRKKRYF